VFGGKTGSTEGAFRSAGGPRAWRLPDMPPARDRAHGDRPAGDDPARDGADERLAARVARRARVYLVIFGLLLAIDLATGSGFWAFWPGIGLTTALALEAAPLVARSWLPLPFVRGAVIIALLTAINLVTWSGHLWVVWPAGALLTLGLLHRLSARSR